MYATRLLVLLLTLSAACSGTSNNNPDLSSVADLAGSAPPDLLPGLPTLTVNNVIAWCDVTVTVGAGAPVTFGTAGMAFQAAASTTITLSATPHATFKPVVWTGVTTMNGSMATYVMTAAAAQSVTACCALANGTGC